MSDSVRIPADLQSGARRVPRQAWRALSGVAVENGENRTLSPRPRPQRLKFAYTDIGAGAPDVISGQVNVLPAQW